MVNDFILKVEDDFEEVRIDKYISNVNPELSRTYIQKLIKDNSISVNDKFIKPSYIVQPGDVLRMFIPDSILPDIPAEDIPLDIAYEDEDLIIVNKPKGMVVHPAPGNYSGTLVNALMYRCQDCLSGINGVLRPGIVHRIDKNTSGLLVVCKNDSAHKFIARQLKVHSVTRRYEAICCGRLKENEGTVDAPIGRNLNDRKKMAVNRINGKDAITHYHVLTELNKGYTHIECRLETGRTHQIRVHMSSLGHPLLGDDIYGGARPGFEYLEGQTLHAGVLGLIRPKDNAYIEFSAPRPAYFEELLKKLS